MKEKNLQTLFSKYMKDHKPDESMAFELKLINLGKCKSKPFNCVSPEQLQILQEIEKDGVVYKIPDQPIFANMKTRFHTQKLVDTIFIKGNGYVVPIFYEPRKRKTAYLIRINNWIAMRDLTERKSFTEQMCKLATKTVINL